MVAGIDRPTAVSIDSTVERSKGIEAAGGLLMFGCNPLPAKKKIEKSENKNDGREDPSPSRHRGTDEEVNVAVLVYKSKRRR